MVYECSLKFFFIFILKVIITVNIHFRFIKFAPFVFLRVFIKFEKFPFGREALYNLLSKMLLTRV